MAHADTLLTTDELLHKYIGFAHSIAAKWKRRHPQAEYDDLHAEVTLGFVEAAQRYDRSRGFAFTTYAAWYALKNVQLFVSGSASRGFHVPGVKKEHMMPYIAVTSLHECNARDGDEYVVAVAQPEDKRFDGGEEWWANVLRVLPNRRDRLIVLLWSHGSTLAEMADSLGLSKERVRQCKEKALVQLRKRKPDLCDEIALRRGA